jgi:hypothetical protein
MFPAQNGFIKNHLHASKHFAWSVFGAVGSAAVWWLTNDFLLLLLFFFFK